MEQQFKFNVTMADIKSLNPCFDPVKKFSVPENWSGTLLDILEDSRISDIDKIWAVTQLVDDKTKRLFAVHCAREALKNIKNPDPRISACIEVVERFANGQATEEERSAAESAAWSAARSAAWSAAESAAWSAAESAARSAAWSAFVQQLKAMITELVTPKKQGPSRDLAYEVLQYFGTKFKSEEAKRLYEKALAELKER